MKQIDCRGLACPEPVLRAKAALEQGAGSFTILVDNEASKENVLRFGHSRNCTVEWAVLADGAFQLSFLDENRKAASSPVPFDEDDYQCDLSMEGPESQASSTPAQRPAPDGRKTGYNLVYVIASDTMGRGSDDLGWALLQTYVATIKEVSPLPSRILFYNGGVKLVATPGKALEALQDLEKKGVKILSCGTCLDFFKLGKNLQVGSSTNMFEIMDSMVSADRVASPF